MNLKHAGFSTRAIHIGEETSEKGALNPPIYQTATFEFRDSAHLAEFLEKRRGYIYTRAGNPTITLLEEKMASLDRGEAALALSSGMAAISTAVLSNLGKGDHMIADEVLYGSTHDFFLELPNFGIEIDFIDTSSPEALEGATRKNTKLVFFETPANPTMKLVDIRAISALAHEHNIEVVVDNTFLTPYFQRPLELGADVVVYSATKYLNGHGDALGGIIVGERGTIQRAKHMAKNTGGILSPFNAWLILRGLKTLGIRMERHSKNAGQAASFLEEHPKIKRVMYPGLKSHPQHKLAEKQTTGSGGMFSFEVKGGLDAAKKLMDRVELCSLAVSLGDVCTLIQHPATMTHGAIPREERLRIGITEELLRLSVGIEDAEDIIADLSQALDTI